MISEVALLPQLLDAKISKLVSNLKSLKCLIILFSGGVDSSFLLHLASRALPKDNILAVIGVSPSLAKLELKEALDFAEDHKISAIKLNSSELDNPAYVANSGNRCYFCKVELNKALSDFLAQNPRYKTWSIADGLQASDDIKGRPGVIASEEFGIIHPLRDANISKDEIRSYFKSINHKIHDKQQSACLSSRLMVGTKVSEKLLNLVEEAEKLIADAGFSNFRVRIHALDNDQILGRIEFSDLNSYWEFSGKEKLSTKLMELGFSYLTLDLTGYKSGGFSSQNIVNFKNKNL